MQRYDQRSQEAQTPDLRLAGKVAAVTGAGQASRGRFRIGRNRIAVRPICRPGLRGICERRRCFKFRRLAFSGRRF